MILPTCERIARDLGEYEPNEKKDRLRHPSDPCRILAEIACGKQRAMIPGVEARLRRALPVYLSAIALAESEGRGSIV